MCCSCDGQDVQVSAQSQEVAYKADQESCHSRHFILMETSFRSSMTKRKETMDRLLQIMDN